MTDDTTTPLLSGVSSNSRDTRQHHRPESPPFQLSSESTPLLRHGGTYGITYGTDEDQRPSSASISQSPLDSEDSSKQRHRRWSVVIAIWALITAVVLILVFGFATPATVKEYTQEAAVFTPQKISIDSATSDGVSVRIQGDFSLDGSRVRRTIVRDIGRFATWIAKEIETSETKVDVNLPNYGNALLGSVFLPAVKVNIREGHSNYIDILANLQSGDVTDLRQVAEDWMSGRLAQLRVQGTANVDIRSGILKFANQIVTTEIILDGWPYQF